MRIYVCDCINKFYSNIFCDNNKKLKYIWNKY